MRAIALILLASAVSIGQTPITIRVDANARRGPLKPIWSYFGYDEPNYTYMKDGRKLIGELSALSWSTVYIRAHNLLTTGDGTPSLKWGSTNAYTEDTAGRPIYDWTLVDRIFDTYRQAGAKPFVEIGFTPEAMSVKPQPYRHTFPQGSVYTGWSHPPKDFEKWGELVRRLALHCAERYGRAEAESWYWEVWNEPDISYWHGTPEQYDRLYEVSVKAVRSVLPNARVGGPGTTGPASTKAAAFLEQFLRFCDQSNVPLDFVSYHAKGSPKVVDGHVRMGLAKELQDVDRGMKVMAGFPRFAKLPIVLSEADPEGCAACSVRTHPQNAYRNSQLYGVYTAAAMARMYELADRNRANLEGMLTWAFEFENQPYFDGFRDLATNGIDKPVLNFFRMAGMMRGDRLQVESNGAAGLDAILSSGVAGQPDVNAIASRSGNEISVLAWNYHDDDLPAAPSSVELSIGGLATGHPVLVKHFRLDASHSNSYAAWKRMGSPQTPSPEQYGQLEAAAQLELLESPRWARIDNGTLTLPFVLPRHAVSLVQLSW